MKEIKERLRSVFRSMDIQEFFQQSVGKWVSQRTSHYLVQNQVDNAKSDLLIEMVSATDPAVVHLCQQQHVDPTQVLCSLKLTWNSIVDRNPNPQKGSSLLVVVPDADANQGRLLQQAQNKPALVGRYSLGTDQVLTLTTETELVSEERIWFANPNFRLRTSVIKQAESCTLASFCSEIRLGGNSAAAKPAAAETAG